MLRDLGGQYLDAWIAEAQASGISQLSGFAAGLLKDYHAVRNGLTLAYSSGAVEGSVCKIKASNDKCSAARASTSSDAGFSSETEPTSPTLSQSRIHLTVDIRPAARAISGGRGGWERVR